MEAYHCYNKAYSLFTDKTSSAFHYTLLHAATTTLSVTTSRNYEDTSPSVHFMSPGLLQLPAVRTDGQPHIII